MVATLPAGQLTGGVCTADVANKVAVKKIQASVRRTACTLALAAQEEPRHALCPVHQQMEGRMGKTTAEVFSKWRRL